MASKKDMRRANLVIPYVDPPKEKSENDISSTMSTTLPMAAMFTRNRLIGWVSVVVSLQNWLAESPDQKTTASTPAYMSVGMSLMAMAVTYMPLFLPSPPGRGSATAAAPPPAPSP